MKRLEISLPLALEADYLDYSLQVWMIKIPYFKQTVDSVKTCLFQLSTWTCRDLSCIDLRFF